MPVVVPTLHKDIPGPSSSQCQAVPAFPNLPPLLSRLPTALLAGPSIPPTPVSASSSHLPVGYTASRLPSIDSTSLALHYALHNLRVKDLEHYAKLSYDSAFNWEELLLPVELEREW